MILCVCLNPTFQSTMLFDSFSLGEVNRAEHHFLDASGKGMNTARILTQLNERTCLLTHLGGNRKDEMLSLCERDKVRVLYADSHSEMRTCTTIISGGVCTELVQEPYPVGPTTEQDIRTLFTEALKEAKAVIISGTRAPGYSKHLYSDFVKEAKQAGKFVLLDIKGEDLLTSLPHRPDVIKPNLSEFMQTFFGKTISEQADDEALLANVRTKMQELHQSYGISIVLSRGKQDLYLFDGTFSSIPVEHVPIVNTIGCGDTLSAVLTKELLHAQTLQQATITATKYATLNAKSIHPGSIV
ncbi:MAG: PfkB family carbohydrate kinase [Sphaerochaeta sp.]